MHAFKDNAGRTWEVSITVAQVKRVRGLLGIDLYKLIEHEVRPLGELLGNPCDLVDVIYVLCKDQAEAKQITDEQFGAALGGDALEDAANAFLQELIDFFPRQARDGLRKMMAKSQTISAKVLAHAYAKIDGIDEEREASALIDSLTKPRA